MHMFLPHDCCHYIMSLSSSPLFLLPRFSYNHSFSFMSLILTLHILMTEPVYNYSKERIPSHVNPINLMGYLIFPK